MSTFPVKGERVLAKPREPDRRIDTVGKFVIAQHEMLGSIREPGEVPRFAWKALASASN